MVKEEEALVEGKERDPIEETQEVAPITEIREGETLETEVTTERNHTHAQDVEDRGMRQAHVGT